MGWLSRSTRMCVGHTSVWVAASLVPSKSPTKIWWPSVIQETYRKGNAVQPGQVGIWQNQHNHPTQNLAPSTISIATVVLKRGLFFSHIWQCLEIHLIVTTLGVWHLAGRDEGCYSTLFNAWGPTTKNNPAPKCQWSHGLETLHYNNKFQEFKIVADAMKAKLKRGCFRLFFSLVCKIAFLFSVIMTSTQHSETQDPILYSKELLSMYFFKQCDFSLKGKFGCQEVR